MKTKLRYLVLGLSLLIAFSGHAQEEHWWKPDSLYKSVQPVASLQLWSLYTMNEKAQVDPNGIMEPVQDRVSFMARRARFGFKGKPYKKLSYVLTVQYDNLGKDKFSGARGGTNTGTFGVLDAYITWQVTKDDLVNISTGYLHPQMSRECITGDMLVNSFDKSPSQGYIRQHIVGKNYGRSTGVNVGGLKKGNVQIGYNVGVFNNVTTAADGKALPETTGKYWSPVTIERVTFSFGDPDMKTYSLNYDVNNFWNKRKGVTIGVYSSQQGRTDIFSHNLAMGADLLFNFANLNVDAEWSRLERNVEGLHYLAETGHIRAGYNLIIAKKFFLEPCIAVVAYDGDNGGQFSGKDRSYDFGLNWYLNKKSNKLSIHYVKQSGSGDNSYTDGETFQKGDFVGLAYVLIL
ncbi:MAG TPA: porin [Chryseolinea sp.]